MTLDSDLGVGTIFRATFRDGFAKGVKMNNWQYEQYQRINEDDHQRMIEEARIVRLIRTSRGDQPGIFEQMMFKLASWMISSGRRLQRRYDISSVKYVERNLATFEE